MRILFIEDDPMTVELVKQRFAILGHWKIFHRAALHEGLDDYAKINPDIVLLDLGLPDATVAQVIEAIPRFTSSAVIPLTGHNDDVIRERATKAGAHAFLSKDLITNERELIKAISIAWDSYMPEGNGDTIRQEIDESDLVMIRTIPALSTKVDQLATQLGQSLKLLSEGQAVTQAHLTRQDEQAAAVADALKEGKQTMQRIDIATQKTNGRLNEVEPLGKATASDVKILMAERKTHILEEESTKLRREGLMVIPRKIGDVVLWLWKHTQTLLKFLGALGLAWPFIQWLLDHHPLIPHK